MIPEIRRILSPVYPGLHDDQSVLKRLHVPGMDVNTFFLSHHLPETSDDQMSKCNEHEAGMIVELCSYLRRNGIAPEKITALTFYNGQRKLIEKKLSRSRLYGEKRPLVVTVDSYQGEENEIVLLSLVRSNVSRISIS